MELTAQEKAFLKNLLTQLTIAPASKDAAITVELVQSLLGKISS